jgi:hypothetical protein
MMDPLQHAVYSRLLGNSVKKEVGGGFQVGIGKIQTILFLFSASNYTKLIMHDDLLTLELYFRIILILVKV